MQLKIFLNFDIGTKMQNYMKIAEYPRVCNEKSFFTEERYKKLLNYNIKIKS
jgi:hypothetical protein